MPFVKATRQKAKLRLALTGVSGAGKTLGALMIGFGMTGDWDKVAVIDTEHERARFYANRDDFGIGEFLYCPMYAPFSPARYKQMVQEGADAVGPDGVVIIDSFSHAWNAEGGVLDIKDRIAANDRTKNSYTAWADAGKEQNSLVNTILAVPCHTICTMRSKMAYALQEDERGKTKPVKMGLAPIQREDTEYEFDIVLDIARNHIATASKDTTFLDQYGEIITPELGKKLRDWLDSGVELIDRKDQESLFALAKQVYGDEMGIEFVRKLLSQHHWTSSMQMTKAVYTETAEVLRESIALKQTEPAEEQTA